MKRPSQAPGLAQNMASAPAPAAKRLILLENTPFRPCFLHLSCRCRHSRGDPPCPLLPC